MSYLLLKSAKESDSFYLNLFQQNVSPRHMVERMTERNVAFGDRKERTFNDVTQ